jgi:LytS/YehU family sensor histidine kinase
LNLLKMQLHPHFLFNTLNAISALVYESPRAADRTISQLSDLLRLSLNSGAAQEVSLKDELEFLRKYVQIQQTLLQERLEVRWDIEPAALDAFVPNMILQPIVENSIRHGIAPLENGGRIEVSAGRFDGSLRLSVCDNGIGLAPDERGPRTEGVGLGNMRARLKHLYGGAHQLSLSEPRGGGLEVRLLIPYRECSARGQR